MKHCIITLCMLVLSTQSKSQNFSFEAGGSLFFGVGKVKTDFETTPVSSSFYGVTAFPKLHFAQTENSSISIGAPVTLGFSGSFNSREGGEFSFGLDAPLVIDYNIGFQSSPANESESGFGGFAGLGFGYSISSEADAFIGSETFKSYGPMAHGGIRFPIRQGQSAIAIRLSYKKGLEAEKFNFFGAGLLYSF